MGRDEANVGTAPNGAGRRVSLPSVRLCLTVCGLAFLWSCLGNSVTVSFRRALLGSVSLIDAQSYAVVMGALYLAAVAVCLAARRPVARLCARAASAPVGDRVAAALGGAGLAGSLLLVASPALGPSVPFATAAVALGLALFAASVTGFVLVWGFELAALGERESLLAVVASNALGFGLQLLFTCVGPDAVLWYLAACPPCAAACWCALTRRAPDPGRRVPEPGCEDAGLGAALRGVPWKSVVPVVVLIYFEQAFSSLLFKRYPAWPQDNIAVTLAVGCVLWLVAAVCLARVALPGRRGAQDAGGPSGRARMDAALATLFAVLLVVYLGALLVTVLFPQDDRLIVERFLVAAGSSFRVLLWLVLLAAVRRGATTPVAGFLCYVLLVPGIPVSRLVSMVLDRMDATSIAALTTPGVIAPAAGVMLFLVAALFILGSTRSAQHAAPASADASSDAERQDAVCAALAAEAGLTARESDVLALVCRGFTAKRAGEKLGISESTVVSHMTHIYRKLGVSSKQDLVALVEGRRG